jgi:hypothetical protein
MVLGNKRNGEINMKVSWEMPQPTDTYHKLGERFTITIELPNCTNTQSEKTWWFEVRK